MIRLLFIFVQWSRLLLRSRASIQAENVVLRHQLDVLRRKKAARLHLTDWDRLTFVLLHRLFPMVLDSIVIVKPETVVRWHRTGFRLFWHWKSRNAGGRPKVDAKTRNLIRRISKENPLWGAPRIHGELLKLGINVCETTVAKNMVKTSNRPGQSWKTFLDNHMNDIASMDFVIVPTISFKLLYCLVILDHRRRRIVPFGVTANPTSEWVARQITNAFPWDEAPQYLIRDRDGAFGHALQQRLEAMGIRDSPTSPRSPWQNGYVERVIGSIRRDCCTAKRMYGTAGWSVRLAPPNLSERTHGIRGAPEWSLLHKGLAVFRASLDAELAVERAQNVCSLESYLCLAFSSPFQPFAMVSDAGAMLDC